MKQLLQNLKSGITETIDQPYPGTSAGRLVIRTNTSLISAGTERMLVDFGKAGLIGKAKSQPEKVKQVLEKIKTDGLAATVSAVRAKLDQPIAMGYCNVGTVIDAGSAVGDGLRVGDRVASNGPHAEVVCVPKQLCARVPDNVSDEAAAFTVIGAIGLQGMRLAQPTLGECFVVIGLGLIGQLTVQLLMANGCRVLGLDMDQAKCKLARQFGAEVVDVGGDKDPVAAAFAFSRGRGVDGVLITAATKSSEPVGQAARMCRKRGRIVLVGVTGLELNRADFYEKELSFQVSCSYGPGRYDPDYEEKGQDYPIGYVRWTEQRNFEAVLEMLACGKLDVRPLITHRFSFEQAPQAYQLISSDNEPYLGILLEYGREEGAGGNGAMPGNRKSAERTVRLAPSANLPAEGQAPVVAVIGAGNFTGQVLLPAIAGTGVRRKIIASGGGVSGTHLGRKFGFEHSTTAAETIFSDMDIDTVFVTTRHDSHARWILRALETSKHVFVEKPLCLTGEELQAITAAYDTQSAGLLGSGSLLMVGFNRRFAPHIVKMKALLAAAAEPMSMIMTVNAGEIPADHWAQDPQVGGGRIVGEACHFIDLLRFLAGASIGEARGRALRNKTGDTASIQLFFDNGSIGTVHYFANGSKAFPKERLEVFCGGRILQMDNFIQLRGFGWKHFSKMKLWRQDKGHAAEVKAFLDAVGSGAPAPIPFDEIQEVSRVAIEVAGEMR